MKNDKENNKKQQKNKYNKLNRRKNVVLHTWQPSIIGVEQK